eukprot:UN26204
MDAFDHSASPRLSQFLFVVLVLLTLVTMLNALISHMADTYDKVRDHSQEVILSARAVLIMELLTTNKSVDEINEIRTKINIFIN